MRKIRHSIKIILSILGDCGKYEYVLTRRDPKTGRIVAAKKPAVPVTK